jgi:fermentation-respiration switch protein FrsA (DUF1100 family)
MACTTSTIDPNTGHMTHQGGASSGPPDGAVCKVGVLACRSAGHRPCCHDVLKWYRVLLVVGLVGAILAVRLRSRRWLFPADEVRAPGVALDATSQTTLRSPRPGTFAARDGTIVRTLELDAPTGGRTIVYFHNNRETIENELEFARSLLARGYGVVLVEYRGYGNSRGAEPSEDGLYLDAEAALDMLGARGISPERIVLWGTSLGTGVAAEMARRGRGSKLILVTPYTSIPDLVTNVVPGMPARVLLADHFDTLAKSPEIRVPTTIVHGDADEIVPFWMGEKIAGAIAGARLLRVRGGHHGDLFAREGDRLLTELVGSGT